MWYFSGTRGGDEVELTNFPIYSIGRFKDKFDHFWTWPLFALGRLFTLSFQRQIFRAGVGFCVGFVALGKKVSHASVVYGEFVVLARLTI